MIDWSAQDIEFNELVPPPDNEIHLNKNGLVVMSACTFAKLVDSADEEIASKFRKYWRVAFEKLKGE